MEITYSWLPGELFTNGFINDCSKLYSSQYGTWSQAKPHLAGKQVALPPAKILEWLKPKGAAMYYAEDNGCLIGYAIAIRTKLKSGKAISWVTQLVVHEEYRHKGVAKKLLQSIWGFSDDFAWGIISANPYAIRALEKATRRRCDPKRIKKNSKEILSFGAENVSYIDNNPSVSIDEYGSKINTSFYLDHSQVKSMIGNVVSAEAPWKLGEIDEGWEWFAFTFRDQPQIPLSADEIKEILCTSDQRVKDAYNRMKLMNGNGHKWSKNTVPEVKFIMKECALLAGDLIYDFGCGNGRHSIELAKNGAKVKAIDYLKNNIDFCRSQQEGNEKKAKHEIEFLIADCRDFRFPEQAKAVICLYDVVGSYADNEDNKKIIRNLYENLMPGGTLLISVMNYEMTEHHAKHRFSFNEAPNEILLLPPSNIMEATGNVFDPDHYLVDTESRIIYRKEQFKPEKSDLPIELIVRDKRFTQKEIEEMCKDVGFTIEFSRYVNATSWEKDISPTDKAAKEILLKCKKLRQGQVMFAGFE